MVKGAPVDRISLVYGASQFFLTLGTSSPPSSSLWPRAYPRLQNQTQTFQTPVLRASILLQPLSQLDKPCQLALPSYQPHRLVAGAPLTLAVIREKQPNPAEAEHPAPTQRVSSRPSNFRRLLHPQTRGHPRCVIGSLKDLYVSWRRVRRRRRCCVPPSTSTRALEPIKPLSH
jgi:hypothetical protein